MKSIQTNRGVKALAHALMKKESSLVYLLELCWRRLQKTSQNAGGQHSTHILLRYWRTLLIGGGIVLAAQVGSWGKLVRAQKHLEVEEDAMIMSGARKVGVVGAGLVGSSFAYGLMMRELATEMVLVDVNSEKAVGEMMDFNHGLSFSKPMKIAGGDYADLSRAYVVVLAAGAAQKPGETRLALLAGNLKIFQSIVLEVVRYKPGGIILIATNPVDILTYICLKESEPLPGRVIGSGAILDTSCFRFLLSRYYDVDARSVHAYIIGEHGDSEISIWSMANIGGVRLQEFTPLKNKRYDQDEMDNSLV